jgi:secreted trypsin-like serine protease
VNQKPDRFLQVLYPRGTSVCPGDSGGPLVLNFPDGGIAYVGVQFAGNGWLSAQRSDSIEVATGEITTFYPFAEVFAQEYNDYLAELVPTTTTFSIARKAKQKLRCQRGARIRTFAGSDCPKNWRRVR